MQKWEYKVVNLQTIDQLNEFGREGWELVAVVRDDDTNETAWVFKRAI